MELIAAFVAFFACVIAWTVLPSAAKTSDAHGSYDAVPVAA